MQLAAGERIAAGEAHVAAGRQSRPSARRASRRRRRRTGAPAHRPATPASAGSAVTRATPRAGVGHEAVASRPCGSAAGRRAARCRAAAARRRNRRRVAARREGAAVEHDVAADLAHAAAAATRCSSSHSALEHQLRVARALDQQRAVEHAVLPSVPSQPHRRASRSRRARGGRARPAWSASLTSEAGFTGLFGCWASSGGAALPTSCTSTDSASGGTPRARSAVSTSGGSGCGRRGGRPQRHDAHASAARSAPGRRCMLLRWPPDHAEIDRTARRAGPSAAAQASCHWPHAPCLLALDTSTEQCLAVPSWRAARRACRRGRRRARFGAHAAGCDAAAGRCRLAAGGPGRRCLRPRARARSPACAPPARWRRAWPSARRARCCAIDSLLIVAEDARAQPAAPRAQRSGWRWTRAWARVYAAAYAWDGARWQCTRAGAVHARRRCRPGGRPSRRASSPARRWRPSAIACTPRRRACVPQVRHRAAALARLARAAWARGAAIDAALALPLYLRDKVALDDGRARAAAALSQRA